MKFIVDTNILIDFLQQREPFWQSAHKLLLVARLGDFELWVSVSQITDAFYLLSEGGKPSRVDQAKRVLRRLRELVRICSLDEGNVDDALDSSWDDFEDACVYQAAKRIKADALITRDAKGFEKADMKVFDCDGLFDWLEREKGLVYEEVDF